MLAATYLKRPSVPDQDSVTRMAERTGSASVADQRLSPLCRGQTRHRRSDGQASESPRWLRTERRVSPPGRWPS